ncbi:MAG: BsuPI-related putative proteinase inhibitor [bacterium]
MKRILFAMTYLVALFFWGCDLPSILSGDDQSLLSNRNRLDLADTLLFVEVTGGIAGVSQSLVVDEFGLALYADSFNPGAKWIIQLSPSELDSLTNLMLENNFFQLKSEYFDEQVEDAFNYSIFFSYQNQENTVKTNYFGAPDNLKRIIDGILQLKSKITNSGLDLKLELSRDEINIGEKVDLKLLITNSSDNPLTLQFSTGQIFDFYAAQTINKEGSDENVIWNWAHDKVFTEALWELVLEAGETKSYQVTWDGHNNTGKLVHGYFIIGAELPSIPGGSPEHKIFYIGGLK